MKKKIYKWFNEYLIKISPKSLEMQIISVQLALLYLTGTNFYN